MPKKFAEKRSSKTPLSLRLEKTLAAYAAAATAAGVSVLAMAEPATARIVFTPSNATVDCYQTDFPIDMNNDGIVDFRLTGSVDYLNVFGASVMGTKMRSQHGYASALSLGNVISSHQGFKKIPLVLAALTFSSGRVIGNFPFTTDRALGVRFKFSGPTANDEHYGWIGFRKFSACQGQLAGWAYETVPGRPIKAGQTQEGSGDVTLSPESFEDSDIPIPATPPALSLGSEGLKLCRKKEN